MIERLDEFDEEKIRTYALDNFEIDQVSQRYMELYKTLLKK